MESGGIYDDSSVENALIKKERISCPSQGLDPLWVSTPSSSFKAASASMMKIDDVRGDDNTENRFLTHSDSKVEEDCNEEFDGSFHHTEKKRRLSPQQVQFLEKNFEIENKLEPERKAQLAKEVGLQPRQVAIWFQNRRARYKTKFLEKEYGSLKESFDKLMADYEALQKQNEKMKNEINLLTEKMSSKDNGHLKQETYDDPIRATDLLPEKAISRQDAAIASAKQDGGSSSAKSDVFDSYSPHYNEGNHSAYLEPAVDSSQVYEPEASDFSQQEDDDSPCRGLLPPSCFPKLEFECHDDLQPNACNLGFPVQNQGTWFWQC